MGVGLDVFLPTPVILLYKDKVGRKYFVISRYRYLMFLVIVKKH